MSMGEEHRKPGKVATCPLQHRRVSSLPFLLPVEPGLQPHHGGLGEKEDGAVNGLERRDVLQCVTSSPGSWSGVTADSSTGTWASW